MNHQRERGELPELATLLMRPLPRLPLQVMLTGLVRRFVLKHPELIERLGETAQVPIAIMPSDLPFAFIAVLDKTDPRINVVSKEDAETAEARIRGPLIILLGLFDGTYDGDAAFFSRDISIEGHTEHILALRNTLEEADLTPAEFTGLSGDLATFVNKRAAEVLGFARRVLHAPEVSENSNQRYGI